MICPLFCVQFALYVTFFSANTQMDGSLGNSYSNNIEFIWTEKCPSYNFNERKELEFYGSTNFRVLVLRKDLSSLESHCLNNYPMNSFSYY